MIDFDAPLLDIPDHAFLELYAIQVLLILTDPYAVPRRAKSATQWSDLWERTP